MEKYFFDSYINMLIISSILVTIIFDNVYYIFLSKNVNDLYAKRPLVHKKGVEKK